MKKGGGPPIIGNEARWWRHTERGAPDECWNWRGALHDTGYGSFSWYVSVGESYSVGAHVASYRLFKGNVAKGRVVMHSCNNRQCVNPAHLSVGTQKQNLAHCVVSRRIAKGERIGLAKLTWAKVREIRKRVAHGEKQLHLAPLFGITQANVSSIIRGVTWKEEA